MFYKNKNIPSVRWINLPQWHACDSFAHVCVRWPFVVCRIAVLCFHSLQANFPLKCCSFLGDEKNNYIMLCEYICTAKKLLLKNWRISVLKKHAWMRKGQNTIKHKKLWKRTQCRTRVLSQLVSTFPDHSTVSVLWLAPQMFIVGMLTVLSSETKRDINNV